MDRRRRLAFTLLNLVLVGSAIGLVFGVESPVLYAFAAVIIALQAPRFFRATTRLRRALVLYLGFVVFCWSFTLVDLPAHSAELASPAGILGLVLRGFAFVMFGHLYGIVFVPVVIAANLLLFPVPRIGGAEEART